METATGESTATATLDGILALLVTAGLSDDQITAATGQDHRHSVCWSRRQKFLERPASVISCARETLTAGIGLTP